MYDLLPCNPSLVKILYKSDFIGGVILEKPPRSSQKSNFLLLRKPLKIYNFTMTNARLMKLTTLIISMRLYLTKNWGVTHRV